MMAVAGFALICIGGLLLAMGLFSFLNIGNRHALPESSTVHKATNYLASAPRRVFNCMLLAGLACFGLGFLLMWAGGA